MRQNGSREALGTEGRTARLCQEALTKTMGELFAGKEFSGQNGMKPLKIFQQDVPIPEDDDEDADTDAAQAPYLVVQMTGGSIPDRDSAQIVEFSLVICAYDTSPRRRGWEDVANIKEDIVQWASEEPYFGGSFTVIHPIAWALQRDDTHPYYYGAVALICTAPAMTQDRKLEEML